MNAYDETATFNLGEDELAPAASGTDARSFLARKITRLANAVAYVASMSLDALARESGLPTFL